MVYALFEQAVKLAFTYRKDHSKSRIKKTKDKNSEQSFDVTTMEIASKTLYNGPIRDLSLIHI